MPSPSHTVLIEPAPKPDTRLSGDWPIRLDGILFSPQGAERYLVSQVRLTEAEAREYLASLPKAK